MPCRDGRCHTVLLGNAGRARSAPMCVTWRRPGQDCDDAGRMCWDDYTCAPTEEGKEGEPARRCVWWAGLGEACGVEGVAGCTAGLTFEREGEGEGGECVARGGVGVYYAQYHAAA